MDSHPISHPSQRAIPPTRAQSPSSSDDTKELIAKALEPENNGQEGSDRGASSAQEENSDNTSGGANGGFDEGDAGNNASEKGDDDRAEPEGDGRSGGDDGGGDDGRGDEVVEDALKISSSEKIFSYSSTPALMLHDLCTNKDEQRDFLVGEVNFRHQLKYEKLCNAEDDNDTGNMLLTQIRARAQTDSPGAFAALTLCLTSFKVLRPDDLAVDDCLLFNSIRDGETRRIVTEDDEALVVKLEPATTKVLREAIMFLTGTQPQETEVESLKDRYLIEVDQLLNSNAGTLVQFIENHEWTACDGLFPPFGGDKKTYLEKFKFARSVHEKWLWAHLYITRNLAWMTKIAGSPLDGIHRILVAARVFHGIPLEGTDAWLEQRMSKYAKEELHFDDEKKRLVYKKDAKCAEIDPRVNLHICTPRSINPALVEAMQKESIAIQDRAGRQSAHNVFDVVQVLLRQLDRHENFLIDTKKPVDTRPLEKIVKLARRLGKDGNPDEPVGISKEEYSAILGEGLGIDPDKANEYISIIDKERGPGKKDWLGKEVAKNGVPRFSHLLLDYYIYFWIDQHTAKIWGILRHDGWVHSVHRQLSTELGIDSVKGMDKPTFQKIFTGKPRGELKMSHFRLTALYRQGQVTAAFFSSLYPMLAGSPLIPKISKEKKTHSTATHTRSCKEKKMTRIFISNPS